MLTRKKWQLNQIKLGHVVRPPLGWFNHLPLADLARRRAV